MTLGPNTFNFTGRIFMLALCVFLIWLLYTNGLPEPSRPIAFLLYFIILLLIGLMITIFSTFFVVVRVDLNEITGQIALRSVFKVQTCNLSEIKGYYKTTHAGRFKIWQGLVIKLKSGEAGQITEQNVGPVNELRNFLDKNKIACLGERGMKFPFR